MKHLKLSLLAGAVCTLQFLPGNIAPNRVTSEARSSPRGFLTATRGAATSGQWRASVYLGWYNVSRRAWSLDLHITRPCCSPTAPSSSPSLDKATTAAP